MKAMVATSPDGRFQIRPSVLIGCALLFAVVILPIFFSHRGYAQMCLLLAASLCVISGWFVLVRYRELDTTWRGWIAAIYFGILDSIGSRFFHRIFPRNVVHACALGVPLCQAVGSLGIHSPSYSRAFCF